jgi:hypothetical protein
MFIRSSGMVLSFSLLQLSTVLGVSSAAATVHLFEIKPEPADYPEMSDLNSKRLGDEYVCI